ncbi:MBL fold metallo-hydrolase [Dactylosporangium matsuzakiense]|uniref:MBL fold metallo-hydrolase n=1 Tax=Dactylosporangium matsuzakiense TaxID=53360 RepID=A0A9W6KK53_9ACTN|nr:MBL fold metallo-hydrolase [Dactylosporangium matsuzakiense]UWZ48085.1 MBL fold metallo-hydrolase [Dactylosporangium matsuzakiense]GLL03572.1 MBL fold metallo-hydrolase [Dactylosporangium matsuzakiense]
MPDLPEPTISAIERGDLTIHTFMAPDEFLADSTHVLETANALVVIDGQFVAPYATAFRRFVDAFDKPIRKVYLSHAHVDHWFGLSTAFADVPVWAAADTIAQLRDSGESERAERQAQYGPFVPDAVVVPEHVAEPGHDTVDGVDYHIDVVRNAECAAQLVLTLPGHGVTIAQDLVYSGTHVYVTRNAANTIALLRIMATSGSDAFLAGHGPVADAAEVLHNADYLAFAEQRLAHDDPATFREALLAAYPQRRCPQLLDIFIPRLFETTALETAS